MSTQICSKCGQLKSLSDFPFRKSRNRYSTICKECWNEYQREWSRKNRVKQRLYSQISYYRKKGDVEKVKELESLREQGVDGNGFKICVICGRSYYPKGSSKTCSPECSAELARRRTSKWIKKWKANHKEELSKRTREYNRKLKLEVISHYSEDPSHPRCICCGEDRIEFLTIDHVDGSGALHRKELRGKGMTFYTWLKKNNYPDGFRVLCLNCNFSLGRYGYCPHNKTPEELKSLREHYINFGLNNNQSRAPKIDR